MIKHLTTAVLLLLILLYTCQTVFSEKLRGSQNIFVKANIIKESIKLSCRKKRPKIERASASDSNPYPTAHYTSGVGNE